MGWFDEQIKLRKQKDNELFSSSLMEIADAVIGSKISLAFKINKNQTKNSIEQILRFFNFKLTHYSEEDTNFNEIIEKVMHPCGIMYRTVKFEKNWSQDSIEPILAINKSDGNIVALIPHGFSGYRFFDYKKQKYVKLTSKNEDLFENEGIVFYKPFPKEKMDLKSFSKFVFKLFSFSDYFLYCLSIMFVTFLGLLMPRFNFLLMGEVLKSGKSSILLSLLIFMICVGSSIVFFQTIKNTLLERMKVKVNLTIQSATMTKVLTLPSSFFKNYSAGELTKVIEKTTDLSSLLIDTFFTGGIFSAFSLVYFSQIFQYGKILIIPTFLMILALVFFSFSVIYETTKLLPNKLGHEKKESGMIYAMFVGIKKIKLAGAEKRAFARWGKLYKKKIRLTYNPIFVNKYKSAIKLIILEVTTVIIYFLSIKHKIPVADFYAFNSAFTLITASFVWLVDFSSSFGSIKPTFDLIKPIFSTESEISQDKKVDVKIQGGIEINNVSFKYNETSPLVLNNFSLKIKSGQYIAIVGKTGCGKSTLIRLLLGFESPNKGAIYYDGKDINTLDLKTLRRQIGSVMQNGQLFSGDIFSNITICAPWLTLDEAWKVAEIAEVAEDIRRMPMGMFTYINEETECISGGQKQRLMIARAIASNPKVLIFDEATSALDNITQKKISQSLDKLHCTRIVVAHRLSTIKQCDRIIYLEEGKIVEDGTYEELIEQNGKFKKLVERQQINI